MFRNDGKNGIGLTSLRMPHGFNLAHGDYFVHYTRDRSRVRLPLYVIVSAGTILCCMACQRVLLTVLA